MNSNLNENKNDLYFQLGVILLLSINLACSSETSTKAEESTVGQACQSGVPSKLVFLNSNAAGSVPLSDFQIQDPKACVSFFSAIADDCGQVVAAVDADSWIVDSTVGHVQSHSANQANICFNQGQPIGKSIQFSVNGEVANLPVSVNWTPAKVNSLFRWYKADQFLPKESNVVVGQSSSPWLDLSMSSDFFNSTAAANREPRFLKQMFSQPTLRICGVSGGCSATSNQHLRIASSYASFANTDFTIYYVVARASSTANFLLVNQSNGNHTGTFMGWISNTQFRVGLAGPSSGPSVTVNIPGYSGVPQLEIWSARLNTGSDPVDRSLRVSRNNQILASDSSIQSQQATAVTIPYIGTQRSDHNGAHFYISEVIIYKKAVSNSENCEIQKYLSSKHEVTLDVPCE